VPPLFRRCNQCGGAAGGDLLPNYWNPTRDEPDIILPSSFRQATVNAGAGAWSAYSVVQAATAAAYELLSMHVHSAFPATAITWFELAVGAAGAEVPIAITALHALISGAGSTPVIQDSRRVGPITIPAGSRLAYRAWTSGAAIATGLFLSLKPSPGAVGVPGWYDPWPNTYIEGARINTPPNYAANDRYPLPVTPNTWVVIANGLGWTQIMAAAPNDLLFNALERETTGGAGGGAGNVFQLARGAAGAEVIISQVPLLAFAAIGYVYGYQEPGRKAIILSGERVSGRFFLAIPAGGMDVAPHFEDL
jgi:hypothetical protein